MSCNIHDLIYVKTNSLPHILCDEIVDNYTDDINNNNFIIDKYSYNMQYDNKYKQVINVLNQELIKNLNKYSKLFYNFDNYILNFNSNFFYIINKIEYNINDIVLFKKNSSQSGHGTRILMFIWFLNDNNGDFVFWNKYKVNNNKGTLLIFPASLFFLYSENMNINSTGYKLFGYIYKQNNNLINFQTKI